MTGEDERAQLPVLLKATINEPIRVIKEENRAGAMRTRWLVSGGGSDPLRSLQGC